MRASTRVGVEGRGVDGWRVAWVAVGGLRSAVLVDIRLPKRCLARCRGCPAQRLARPHIPSPANTRATAGKGIKLVKGDIVTALEGGADGRVAAAVLKSGGRLEASLVLVGVGARPNTDLLAGQVRSQPACTPQAPGGPLSVTSAMRGRSTPELELGLAGSSCRTAEQLRPFSPSLAGGAAGGAARRHQGQRAPAGGGAGGGRRPAGLGPCSPHACLPWGPLWARPSSSPPSLFSVNTRRPATPTCMPSATWPPSRCS